MDEKRLRELLRERGILHPVNHPLSVGRKGWPGMGRIDRREFVKIAGLAGAVMATGVGGVGCTTPTSVVGEGPAPDPFERELALLAVDAARSAGANYVDVRVSRHWNESVSTREEQITGVGKSDSYGIGVRALVGGSWGFSGTRELTTDAVAEAAREATAIAAANDRVAPSETILAPVDAVPDGRWVTPHEIDPLRGSDRRKGRPLICGQLRGDEGARGTIRFIQHWIHEGKPSDRYQRGIGHPADFYSNEPQHEHHGGIVGPIGFPEPGLGCRAGRTGLGVRPRSRLPGKTRPSGPKKPS